MRIIEKITAGLALYCVGRPNPISLRIVKPLQLPFNDIFLSFFSEPVLFVWIYFKIHHGDVKA